MIFVDRNLDFLLHFHVKLWYQLYYVVKLWPRSFLIKIFIHIITQYIIGAMFLIFDRVFLLITDYQSNLIKNHHLKFVILIIVIY